MTEHEELLALKELVEKMKNELTEKDAFIEKQNIKIEKQNIKIEKQNIKIENMMQVLLHARKKFFGASTEATQIEGQLCLFDDSEVMELSKKLYDGQKKICSKPHKRVPRQPGVRQQMLAGLPKEVIECIIPSDEKCSVCGGELKVIGKEIVRTEVEYIEPKIIVKQIIRQIAKCAKCGTADSDNPKDHFQKAAVPTPVLPHSIATPSLVAGVLNQKFNLGVPFARQEGEWYRIGLDLSRSNMANWTIRCCEEWLEPLYERIHAKLLECKTLHMDETRIQCNKEAGKKAHSESFMWVIRSGEKETVNAAFFFYSRNRNGDNAKNLLKGFHGYLTTDAYSGYEKVEGITRNLCWSHVRRYFIDSIPPDSRGREIPGSKGAEACEYINLLFKVEEKIKDLPPDEKKEKRQEASLPILDAFWSWVEKTSKLTTTNENLTKALTYAANQKKYLMTFLEDGSLPISNNRCEATIRPFATARRAWLFADTPKGAAANAVMYTLTECAKANNLKIYEYFKYLLTEIPNLGYDYNNKPELLDKYLPWSDELPKECRVRMHYTKSN